jgi:hypothetical protein
MATIPDLMQANLLGVFNERDPARRREVIAATYAEDVVFTDPEGAVQGRDALDAKAQGLLDASPDFVFTPAGPVRVAGDLGHLAWNLGPEGEAPVVRGVDVALVEDERITRLYTLLLTD